VICFEDWGIEQFKRLIGNKSIDLSVNANKLAIIKIPMRSIRSIALVSFFLFTCLFLIGISPMRASEEAIPGISSGNSNISIATAWKNISTDENACIDRSRTALQNAGFQNITVASQSISGDFEQYKGTVRCAASEKMAFFVVAGFNTDTAFRRVSEIYDNF
jgi:hypothetical protein